MAVGVYALSGGRQDAVEYRMAKVQRGQIVKTISASGALNAVVAVAVGSQVSGQIKELLADFNSEVRKGQVIARIDPESFQARVRQADADLAVARAAVWTKEAAVMRARADYQNAVAGLAAAEAEVRRNEVSAADLQLDLGRKIELHKRGLIAVSEADKARAAYETSLAQLKAAEAQLQAHRATIAARQAQVRVAEAEVEQARTQAGEREAALGFSRVDLQNTVIRSPVDGVVIARSVDVGQTVAASLNAPTLFTIAQDLRKMQVETNIDEADIGQIETGQPAKFNVDSFPGREFEGIVTQIRKASQTVQNVVTYTVVITAENPELRLLPGMTANVQVLVSERADVLKIPNAALRFRPPAAEAETAAPAGFGPENSQAAGREPQGGRGEERLARLTEQLGLSADQRDQVRELTREVGRRLRALRQGGTPEEDVQRTARELRRQQDQQIMGILLPGQRQKFEQILKRRTQQPLQRAQIWIIEGGRPKALSVFTGVSDGAFTELARGDLAEGQEVIVGMRRGSSGAGRTASRRRIFGLGF